MLISTNDIFHITDLIVWLFKTPVKCKHIRESPVDMHIGRLHDTLWLQAWQRQMATLAGEATPSFGFVSAFCFTCASCWNETEIKQFGRCRQEVLFQFYFSFISVSFYMCGRLNSLKTNAVKKVDPTKKHFFNIMCDLLTGSLILPC